jgi:hypothetical protein
MTTTLAMEFSFPYDEPSQIWDTREKKEPEQAFILGRLLRFMGD